MVDRELIIQQRKTQINKDNFHENRDQVDHDYNEGHKIIFSNHSA